MITQEIRDRLRTIIEPGLVAGMGRPEPGSMCVEAAICLAMGEPFSETPSCVSSADREWAFRINDAPWPSNKDRAESLLPIALAQLGTAGAPRTLWTNSLVTGTIRRILPIAFRAASYNTNGKPKSLLQDMADRCERGGSHQDAVAAEQVAVAIAADEYHYNSYSIIAARAAHFVANACGNDNIHNAVMIANAAVTACGIPNIRSLVLLTAASVAMVAYAEDGRS